MCDPFFPLYTKTIASGPINMYCILVFRAKEQKLWKTKHCMPSAYYYIHMLMHTRQMKQIVLTALLLGQKLTFKWASFEFTC